MHHRKNFNLFRSSLPSQHFRGCTVALFGLLKIPLYRLRALSGGQANVRRSQSFANRKLTRTECGEYSELSRRLNFLARPCVVKPLPTFPPLLRLRTMGPVLGIIARFFECILDKCNLGSRHEYSAMVVDHNWNF